MNAMRFYILMACAMTASFGCSGSEDGSQSQQAGIDASDAGMPALGDGDSDFSGEDESDSDMPDGGPQGGYQRSAVGKPGDDAEINPDDGGKDDGAPSAAPASMGGSQAVDASAMDAGREEPSTTATGFEDPAPQVSQPVEFALGAQVPTERLCGAAFDHLEGRIWIAPCSGALLTSYEADGTEDSGIPTPGESTNDVDVDVAPIAFRVGGESVGEGSLVFFNGEMGPVEIYALDKVTGDVHSILTADFGDSHVVGGAFHARRGTFFLVQDRRPRSPRWNLVAEVDAQSGEVRNEFSLLPDFDVDYGDIEVCNSTGNVLVASDIENSIAEFTAEGELRFMHPLPSGVGNVAGIAVDDDSGTVWVGARTGVVTELRSELCPPRQRR